MFFRSIIKHLEAKISHVSKTLHHGGHDRDHGSKFCKDDDDKGHKNGWDDWKDKHDKDDDDDKHGWHGGKDKHRDDKDDKHDGKGRHGDDDDDKHGWNDWKDHIKDIKNGWKDKFDDRHGCRDDKDDKDDEDPKDPQEPTYEKVFFGYEFDEDGKPLGGYFIEDESPNPNPYSIPALPEGTEPTFENYLSHFESIGGDVTQTKAISFYETAEDGTLQESFRVEAPEGGFEDADDVLEAYEDALEENDVADLMVSLSVETDPEDEMPEMADDEDEQEEAWAA